MLKALLKKQALELGAFFYQSGKAGKRRSKGVIALYVLLMVYVAAVGGGLYYMTAKALCVPLTEAGMGWLYFALMGLSATVLGVIGSIFMAYSGLYLARDNELLLAMPIPTWKLLLARLSGVYAMALLMEAIALLPGIVVYQQVVGGGLAAALCGAALLLLLPLLAVTLSCVLGWLVALLSSRMRHKAVVVLPLFVVGMGLYFYAVMRLNTYLQLLLVNSAAVGQTVRRVLYPLYRMGLAAQGSIVSLGIFTLMVLAVFALTWLILERSFLRIATTRRGGPKARYREKGRAAHGLDRALLGRELARFAGSSTYMLNCGIGSLFLLAAAVAALVRGRWLVSMLEQIPGLAGAGALLPCAGVALLASTGTITAPSVSLEGRTLWLMQSLPVSGWRVLRSKLTLHMLLVGVPALLCAGALVWVLRPGLLCALLTLAFSFLFVLFCAAFGLAANLKLPNLSWTNETVPVKQSASVILAMLGAWVVALVLIGAYVLIGRSIAEEWFLLLCTLVVGALAAGTLAWLRRRGAALWDGLGS